MKNTMYAIAEGKCCIRVRKFNGKSGFRASTNDIDLHQRFEQWCKDQGKWNGCRFGFCQTQEEAQADLDLFAQENNLVEVDYKVLV